MVFCCIYGCKSRDERKEEGVSFHGFPQNEVLRTLWMNATGRQNWKPGNNSRICSKHFDRKCIYKTNQRTFLRSGAYPTIRVHTPGDTTFTKTEKTMIINACKNIEKTWPKGQTLKRILLFEKTAAFLGLTLHAVSKILKEYECKEKSRIKTGQVINKIEKDIKSDILKTVHDFYMKGEIATANKVFQIIKDRYTSMNVVTFKKVLEEMKYKYVEKKNVYAIIDNEYIIESRVNYLRTIKEYRQTNKCIYYVDEMFLSPEIDKVIMKNNKKNLVVVHIGDKSGFVNDALGFFFTKNNPDDELKATSFEKWFEKVLPKLNENSIVVMDDTPQHSNKERVPNMEWSKDNIKSWLQQNGVIFDQNITKIELINIVKDISHNQLFKINKMANTRNIKVLRSPAYHDLNPLKSIWTVIKGNVLKNNIISIEELRKLVENDIENLPETIWLKSVDEVVEKEVNLYSKIDAEMDKVIDEFLLCNNNESGESTASCPSDLDD